MQDRRLPATGSRRRHQRAGASGAGIGSQWRYGPLPGNAAVGRRGPTGPHRRFFGSGEQQCGGLRTAACRFVVGWRQRSTALDTTRSVRRRSAQAVGRHTDDFRNVRSSVSSSPRGRLWRICIGPGTTTGRGQATAAALPRLQRLARPSMSNQILVDKRTLVTQADVFMGLVSLRRAACCRWARNAAAMGESCLPRG